MSRLPRIKHSFDENNVTNNSVFQDITELTDLGERLMSESRSQANTPKSIRPNTRKSILKEPAYDGALLQLESLAYPTIDPEQTMKNRISNLESTANTQANGNALTVQTFRDMGVHVNNVEFAIRDIISDVQAAFDAKLATMKKEYDHRFELQACENKRLQSHVASLKADSSMLKKKLQQTSDKLKRLQQEFGAEYEEDPIVEEPSVLSATGFSTAPSTRPNTIH